jgi:hypothetical protein
MTSAISEPRAWAPRRWVAVIAVILAVQLGFIFWLGDRQPVRPRKPKAAPALTLTGSAWGEWLALTDPTLFALPHARVFSGPAWLQRAPQSSPHFEWKEDPRWLGLPVQLLGASFARMVPADSTLEWQAAEIPEPHALLPEINHSPLIPGSSLRLEGGLAQRRLLSQPNLPSWPPRALNPTDTDMLTNTVIQVLVDAEGRPVSLTLLGGSGHGPADDLAMSLVTNFKFEPLPAADPLTVAGSATALNNLSWGQVVFEWQTTGLTNTPAPPL